MHPFNEPRIDYRRRIATATSIFLSMFALLAISEIYLFGRFLKIGQAYVYFGALVDLSISISLTFIFWKFASRSRSPDKVFRDAFARGEFSPYLQPMVDATTAEWVGAEVLARWHYRRLEFVVPDKFIPVAEDHGFTGKLTRSLMADVARGLGGIRFPAGFYISFNVSPSQIVEADFVDDCRHFLQALRGKDVQLVLEITERQRIVPDAIMQATLARVRALGIRIALDDFGTGSANLHLLNDIPVDIIKLDRSFVSRVDESTTNQPLLDSMIDLANLLNVNIIAEGIETATQATYLKNRGVKILQGFVFSRPLSIENFVQTFPEGLLSNGLMKD